MWPCVLERSALLSQRGRAMLRVSVAAVFTARRVCIARTMPWQDRKMSVRPCVCLSVRLSHAGIESKRL